MGIDLGCGTFWVNVILEGDSLLTCCAFSEPGFPTESPLVDFISSIKSLLASHEDWRLHWVLGRHNSMAHLLPAWIARSLSFGFIPLQSLSLQVLQADFVFEPA